MYMEIYKRIIQYTLLATAVLLTTLENTGTEFEVVLAKKGEWMDAFKICNSTGGVFSKPSCNTGEKCWGNGYMLQTSFLSYKGCHTAYGQWKKRSTLDGPDLVACYKRCQNTHCPSELWIGIQSKSCCCNCGNPENSYLRPPERCHIDCSLRKEFAKCGGNSHISVYKEIQVNGSDEIKNCVNIDCNNVNRPSFHFENCEDKKNSLCGVIQFDHQPPVSWRAINTTAMSWINTMESCYNYSGYLLDDVDKAYCKNHTYTGQKYWTSIHRYQNVLSVYNTGVAYQPDLCEVFQNGSSSFQSCQQQIDYRCTSEIMTAEVLISTARSTFKTEDMTTNAILTDSMTTPNNTPTKSRKTFLNLSESSTGRHLTFEPQETTVTPFLTSKTSVHFDQSVTSHVETNSKISLTEEMETTRISSLIQSQTHSAGGEIIKTTRNRRTLSTVTSQSPRENNNTMAVQGTPAHSENLVSIIAGSVSSLVVLIMVVTGIICWKRKTSRITSNKSNEEEAQLRLRHLERNCEDTPPVEYATPNKLTSRYQSVHRETRNEKLSNSNAANVGVTYATVDKRNSLMKSEQDERTYTNYPAMKEHMQKFNSGRSNENEENYYVASIDETYDELRGRRERIGGRNNSDDLYSHTVSSSTEDGDCEYSYSTHKGCNSGDVSEHYGNFSATSGL